MAVYYSTLRNLWEEIDFYKTFKSQCTGDAALYSKEIEENWIFELLDSEHLDYEAMYVQILARDPLNPLDEVFSYLS